MAKRKGKKASSGRSASETWVASGRSDRKHTSMAGPWSGHEETTEWSVELRLEADRFQLTWSWSNEHTASNRGSRTNLDVVLAGPVRRLESGASLLSFEEKVRAERRYSEPGEDMWTPEIREEEDEPSGPLPDDERFVLRAARAGAGLALKVHRRGERAASGWLRESSLLEALKAGPLRLG